METVLDAKWKGRGGARLHIASEGMILLDSSGAVVGTVPYEEVLQVETNGRGPRSSLRLELRGLGRWVLEGIHPLQARYAAEMIREQVAAVERRNLPLYRQPQPLGKLPEICRSLLDTAAWCPAEVLDFLLAQAVHHRASDVHLEPFPSELRVRLRVDGTLVDVAVIPLLWAPRLLARIKVLANLATYRTDTAQEGRFPLQLADRTVDVRASLLPTLHGEKAVLRLFDPARQILRLEELGMPEAVRSAWEALLGQPQGMLLLTGPSNHGKTTTMYASLQFLHETRRDLSNLCTVEDPVEYDLRVINQTQVNPTAGLTFAAGLRTVLRQDPEVIMIGEIRDEETARIAVRAGLTGHLILSTVHAPSAAGVFARLVDLGCEPFLVASAVSAVLSQRLVRTVCAGCRRPAEVFARQRALLRLGDREGEWSRGEGCEACGGTGYRGRTGIFHLLRVTDAVREAIQAGRSTAEIEAIAGAADGLREDGLARAAAGITSLDELERVLGAMD